MENPNSGRTPVYSRVFIETNLDTHLAVTVSDTDTFGDLKKKILLEHPMCFPIVGDIQISAVKMKLRGRFYHVSDLSLITKDGAAKRLFLYVDATPLAKGDENQDLPGIGGNMEVIGTGNCFPLDGLKRSDTGDMSLQVVESEAVKPRPVNPQLGSTISNEEVLRDSEKVAEQNASHRMDTSLHGVNDPPMEGITVVYDKVSTVDNNMSVLGLLDKSSNLVTNSVNMDNNAKIDSRTVLGSMASKETFNGEAVENKKDKTKRKTISSEYRALEKNSEDINAFALTSIAKDPENYPDDVDKVSVDMVGKNKMAFEPLNKVTLDAMEQFGTEDEIADILVQVTGSDGDVVLHEKDVNIQDTDKLLEEVSPLLSAAKKKRKVGKKSSKEDSSNGYSDLTSNKGTTTSKVISANQITTNSSVVKHTLTASPSTGKRKQKKKASKDINPDAGPLFCSSKYIAEETVVAPMVEAHKENFGAELDEAIVPVEEQDGMISEISHQDKLDELNKNLVEKEPEAGGMDIDDLGSIKAPSVALDNPHDIDVAISMRDTNEVGNLDIMVQDFKKPEDIGYSDGMIDVVNDNKAASTDPPSGVEGQLSKNDEEESLTNKIEVEIGADRARSVKSSKSKKKSRKTKGQVEDSLVASNSQLFESSGAPASSTEPVKAVRREEPNNIIQNVLESLQLSLEDKETSEKNGDKSRKKTKKKRKSDDVDAIENNVAHNPKSSTDGVKEIDDLAKTPRKAKRAKKSGVKHLNETKNELKNNPEVDTDSLHTKQHPEVGGSLPDKSHNPNGSSEYETKGVAGGDLSGGVPAHETSIQTKISLGKEKLDVNENFTSERNKHDTVSNSEMLDQGVDDTKATENETKTAKNKKMTDLLPADSRNVSKGSLEREKQSSRKAQPTGSETSQHQSKVKNDNALAHSKKKVQKISEGKSSRYLSDKIDETLRADKLSALGDTVIPKIAGRITRSVYTKMRPRDKEEEPIGGKLG